jgi:putative ABC transport system permease protein
MSEDSYFESPLSADSDGPPAATITFLRILRRSLIHRRARSMSALVALTVSAAVATALLTLYADLDAKLHHTFRSFGANIVLTAPSDAGFGAQPVARAEQAVGTVGHQEVLVAPFSYAVATTQSGTPVVVAGTDFDAVRRLDDWWQVDTWPPAWFAAQAPAVPPPAPALIGQRAAQFIGDAHNVTLTFAGHSIPLQLAGHLRTGGDEDSRIYIPMAAFMRWTGLTATVLEVQVPGSAARVEAAIASLQREFPGAKVEPIRQLVEGESRIIDRTHALMYAAVLLIALTVGVSVLATLSASILERRRDFALMKALGGSHRNLMALFLVEALVLALAGVVTGFVIGSAAAFVISEINFHTATLPYVSVIPIILLLNVAIAAAAAFFPARVLRSLQPAALLRGD